MVFLRGGKDQERTEAIMSKTVVNLDTMEREEIRAYDNRLYTDDLLESFGYGFDSISSKVEEEYRYAKDEY